jgi:hypothetical protein
LEHFVVVGDGKGSHLMHLLHLTLQARHLHCSGCHFELKQAGFTATYRPRQSLLTSRNTFILVLRAVILQPHGSASGPISAFLFAESYAMIRELSTFVNDVKQS